MKKSIFVSAIILMAFFISSGQSKPVNSKKIYHIIETKRKFSPEENKKFYIAEVNLRDINKLNEPLRALAGYYSAIAGSNCLPDSTNEEVCDLTSALGLGKQCSKEHNELLEKWFEHTTELKQILSQKCYLNSQESSDFSNYNYLTFKMISDTVFVKYQVLYFDQGSSEIINYHDIAIVKKDKIKFIKK